MEEKEFNTTFAIPANYTDSGKIFGGMLEPRNAVEALILILAIGYPELMLIPMATTIRIVVMTVTLIPIGILAAMGIDGDSLFQYAGHIICYLAHRRKPRKEPMSPASISTARKRRRRSSWRQSG